VDVYHYPRLGAGQFYEKLADRVRLAGGVIMTDTTSTRVLHDGRRIYAVEVREDDGTTRRLGGDFFLSSAPLTAMLRQFDPPPPPDVQAATDALRYRHHLSVQLVLEGPSPFPDNWIYIHSPDVKMARVCSYANFSTAMAASHGLHPLTAEYFCFDDDVVWQLPDVELLALAQQELASMGLCRNGRWRGGYVIRSKQSYPVIEQGYERHIEVIKAWLNKYENFLPIGRSGMFKYNNQDHAIYTGVLAARTAAGHGPFDPWRVNIDATYHEGEEQEQGG
jgi:protoporphyrinogen oxidase